MIIDPIGMSVAAEAHFALSEKWRVVGIASTYRDAPYMRCAGRNATTFAMNVGPNQTVQVNLQGPMTCTSSGSFDIEDTTNDPASTRDALGAPERIIIQVKRFDDDSF